MNEEFYSIGRGSLNINGKFYYGLDYEITDFMRSLEEENKQLKENYECILKQRDDLTKNATEQLESSVGIVKHNRAIQEHIDKERELQNQLQQKEDTINKAKEELYIWGEALFPEFQKKMLKILDNKGDEK